MAHYDKVPWQANTAYLLSAVVTPVTPDGRVFRCTTAGTSGNAEPSWPVADPWTVTDGTVVWAVGTSFRQDVNDGIASVFTAFAAANPTLLRKVYTERPANVGQGELPAAWIDNQPETITYVGSVRQRVQVPTAVVVDRTPDAEQFSDRINFLVDALIDAFTAAVHAAGGRSIVTLTGTTDVDIDEGGVHVSGVSLAFDQTAIQEGRQ